MAGSLPLAVITAVLGIAVVGAQGVYPPESCTVYNGLPKNEVHCTGARSVAACNGGQGCSSTADQNECLYDICCCNPTPDPSASPAPPPPVGQRLSVGRTVLASPSKAKAPKESAPAPAPAEEADAPEPAEAVKPPKPSKKVAKPSKLAKAPQPSKTAKAPSPGKKAPVKIAAKPTAATCWANVTTGSSWREPNGKNYWNTVNVQLENLTSKNVTIPYTVTISKAGFNGVVQWWNWSASFKKPDTVTGDFNYGFWQDLLAKRNSTASFGAIVSSSKNDFAPVTLTLNGKKCLLA